MKKTRIIAILLAVIIVTILAMMLLPQEKAPAAPAEETKKIVVAAADIPAYTKITADMLEMKEYPLSLVPPESYEEMDSLIDARPVVDLVTQEVIIRTHVVEHEEKADVLSLNITPGMRAMSIPVDDVSGVCNLIKTGDHVDLVVSTSDLKQELLLELFSRDMMKELSDSGADMSGLLSGEAIDWDNVDIDMSKYLEDYALSSDRSIGLMLLQDIEVLALDQTMLGAPMNENLKYQYRTVTLSVRPEDTVKLAWAMTDGVIYLALRSGNDTEIVDVVPYHAWDAMGMNKQNGEDGNS